MVKIKYTAQQNEIARLMKAIGHPARVAILQILSEGEKTCNDIVTQLPIAQSTVSQHLRELCLVGIVVNNAKHPTSYYSIKRSSYNKAIKTIEGFLNEL